MFSCSPTPNASVKSDVGNRPCENLGKLIAITLLTLIYCQVHNNWIRFTFHDINPKN